MSLDTVAAASGCPQLRGRTSPSIADGFTIDYTDWGFYEPQYWRNYAHTHSYFEVCLAYAGTGEFAVDGQRHEVSAGEVFIARPGQVHQIISSNIDPLGIAFWGFALIHGKSAEPELPGWWRGLLDVDAPVSSSALGSLPTLLGALTAEVERPRSGERPVIAALATALAIETGRAFATPAQLEPAGTPDQRPVLVALMERYLRDNLDGAVTVRDVAAHIHLSERHAERVFRAAVGEPLMSRLRRLRLDLATQLLLDTDLGITETAQRCGYPEVRAFSTVFRRRYGQSPSQFRSTGGTRQLTD